MEIQSKLEKKTIEATLLTIRINPKEKDRLVEVLNSLLKKAKPDRFEEYVIKQLIEAIENPAQAEPEIRLDHDHNAHDAESIIPSIVESDKFVNAVGTQEVKISNPEKITIINKIKSQTDPQNKENLTNWMRGSIKFAQEQMGVKTKPNSDNLEDFYDWLVSNLIIDVNGNPLARK